MREVLIMIKKILNKEEKKIYDLTIRPLIIYSIILIIIVGVGTLLKTLTEDIINGYICSYFLYTVIQYMNLVDILIFRKVIKKETDCNKN